MVITSPKKNINGKNERKKHKCGTQTKNLILVSSILNRGIFEKVCSTYEIPIYTEMN